MARSGAPATPTFRWAGRRPTGGRTGAPPISGMLRAALDRRSVPRRRSGPCRRDDPAPGSRRDLQAGARLTFDSLGLSADLLRTVAEEGYTAPTPVQTAAIPLVLEGRDVLAAAQTGTGKTAAFVLPILDRLRDARQHELLAGPPPGPRADPRPDPRARDAGRRERPHLRPDRARSARRSSTAAIPMDPQIKALRGGIEILVATPGRLLDLVGQQVANLGQVEILVLDEADRMLDMGFLPDIQRIIALLPAKRQNLLFSATFSDDIRRLSGGDPARPGHGRGRAAEHRRRGRPPARLPGRPRPQGGAARPPDPQATTCTRCSSSRGRSSPRRRLATRLDRRGPRRGRDPLRPLAAGADAGARGLQERRDPGPRRDRRRRARPRHRGPAGRRQLRAAVEPAGLHPPHRPDRPGGRDRRGHLARLHRRDRPAARRPADAQAGDPVDRRGGLHPRPQRRAPPALDAGGRSRPHRPEHHAHRKPVHRSSNVGSGRRR